MIGDAADPVAVSDIAARIGVALDTVQKWRQRFAYGPGSFPASRWTAAGSPLWHWPDVQAWLRATGRPSEPVFVELLRGEAAGIGADLSGLASLSANRRLWAWLDEQGYGPDDPDLWARIVPADAWAPDNEPAAQFPAAVTVAEMQQVREEIEAA